MDTISSRESNNNFLPMAGVIVGALALILAIVALVKISSLGKEVVSATSQVNDVRAKVDSYDSQISQIAQGNDAVKATITNVAKGTNDAFGKVSEELSQIKGRLDKIEQTRVAHGPAVRGTAAGGEAAVAGADEYLVVGGDTGVKIATKNGVKLSDLMAVNPDVNWSKLHIGQKIKLPKK